MKRIVITGANGQLGRSLQKLQRSFDNCELHFCTKEDLDITDSEAIAALFTKIQPHYCINCAAYTQVDKAESEPEEAFLINETAVKYLADACKANNTVLVHISTDYVFDGEKRTPYTETDSTNPLNVYGASKLAGEKAIQQRLKQYVIVRTSWLYSPYGKNFVKTIAALSKERDKLAIVDDQIGSPTFAEDLVFALAHLINREQGHYGVYHFSNKGSISWFDFGKAIAEMVGGKAIIESADSSRDHAKAKRPAYAVLDTTKFEHTFDFHINEWRESLSKYLIECCRQNQQK